MNGELFPCSKLAHCGIGREDTCPGKAWTRFQADGTENYSRVAVAFAVPRVVSSMRLGDH